jgi:hypothetical protein
MNAPVTSLSPRAATAIERLAACAHALYEAERAYTHAVRPDTEKAAPWADLDLEAKRAVADRIQAAIARPYAAALPDDPYERGLAYLRRQLIAAMYQAHGLATRKTR